MAAVRRRKLLSSRRRVQDDGEEDEALGDLGDDSLSEASDLTDIEDHRDAEDSDNSEVDKSETGSPHLARASEEIRNAGEGGIDDVGTTAKVSREGESISTIASAFTPTEENLAMMKGVAPRDADVEDEAIHFEDSMTQAKAAEPEIKPTVAMERVSAIRSESIAQRRTREHEEYKQKRDTDPAFVPTRGGFFMHDHRSGAFSQGPFGSFGRERGRGRDFAPNPYAQSRPGPMMGAGNATRWNHDLHETITGPKPPLEQKQAVVSEAGPPRETSILRTASLSKDVTVGMVMVRIYLPESHTTPTLQKMAVRQYTRLPDLRPPLRRDKPVRVSLPNRGPRYVFPSAERSFIFIPRAQRPNQPAARSRIRTFLGQPQSRRTSTYGGSVHESSITMSRRSSTIPDTVVMPDGFVMPKSGQGPTIAAQSRPVVKLPSGMPVPQASPSASVTNSSGVPPSTDGGPSGQAYPPPSQPTYREARPTQLPMHQPRPQKTVSVATIDPPSTSTLHAPQQQLQQPFYHQVPAHIIGQAASDVSSSTRERQLSQGLAIQGTPITNIPEGAINAQPFQPGTAMHQSVYAPSFPTQPVFFYPPPATGQMIPYTAEGLVSPAYLQQGSYLVPGYLPAPASADEAPGTEQVGMFAQERNGMVYYYDSSVVGNSEGGPDRGYSVPTNAGAAEGYYYGAPSNMIYYPTQ